MIGETTSSTPLEDLEGRRAEALAMGGRSASSATTPRVA